MSMTQDRQDALDEYDALLIAKGAAQRKLNKQAVDLRRQAVDEPNQAKRDQMEALADQIALKAIELNRENFRLLHTRNRILVSMSLSGVIAHLRGLTRDSEKAVDRMEDLAKVLGAAADMINIIRRFAALVA